MERNLIILCVFKERIKLGSVFTKNLVYTHAECSSNKPRTRPAHFSGMKVEIYTLMGRATSGMFYLYPQEQF